jgi:hypothetical protein
MNFIKKWWKPIAGMVLVAVIAYTGKATYDALFIKAEDRAKAKYEAKIAAAETAKQKSLAERDRLAEQAGKDREAARLRAEEEKRKADNVFAIFKSETAEKLKGRDATIAEVLAEKEKDEIVITEAKDIIEFQYAENMLLRSNWKLSDERIAAANKEAMDNLALQYSACQDWSAKLEKKLRPTFWGRFKEGAKLALAFGAGYAAGKTL